MFQSLLKRGRGVRCLLCPYVAHLDAAVQWCGAVDGEPARGVVATDLKPAEAILD